MATVRVSVVHDETGKIMSVSRPSESANVIVLSGDGQSVLEAEVDEDDIHDLVTGKHLVDAQNKQIIKRTS
jgi:hypothetical protein